MSDMTQLDRNFAVNSTIGKEGVRFYSIDQAPFALHGVVKENGWYRRMPEQVAEQVSKRVGVLHKKPPAAGCAFAPTANMLPSGRKWWV